ncbi:hypothetical protein CPB86DRAFT_64866 [Serendipita vermifera]|nr:hypothetical protein CPB86DRAFT_64866 [Serendipita vermifera]
MIIRITGFLNHMDESLQLIAQGLLTDLAMIDPIPVVITVAVHNLGDEDLLVRQNSVTILLDFASQEKLRAKVATVDNMVTIGHWLRHTNPDKRLGALTVMEELSKYDTRDGILKSGVVETIIDLLQDLTFGDSELPAQSVLNLG